MRVFVDETIYQDGQVCFGFFFKEWIERCLLCVFRPVKRMERNLVKMLSTRCRTYNCSQFASTYTEFVQQRKGASCDEIRSRKALEGTQTFRRDCIPRRGLCFSSSILSVYMLTIIYVHHSFRLSLTTSTSLSSLRSYVGSEHVDTVTVCFLS